ncbi:MAG TPA: hypothetical protein VNO21_24530, partial [Polyangiaceae bacterium]|nr:hypothetical protein [Polyangiaceae bacterium]
SDGAHCIAMVVPWRALPSVVSAERLDAAMTARMHRDFKTRVAVAAARTPAAIPQLAMKHGLYAVQIIRWKNDLLNRFAPRG